MWPEKKSGKPANVLPPRWNAPRKLPDRSATGRLPAPKRPTKPCMSILTKPLPSALGSGRSLVISSAAGVPATATDFAMEESPGGLKQLTAISKRLARRLLTIGENRLELLMVEVQEEGEHLLHAFLLALVAAVFGLLAGMTL